jgi:cyanophycinase
MKTSIYLFSIFVALTIWSCGPSATSEISYPINTEHLDGTGGNLVIIGGGGRPASIMQKIIELSADSSILVIPMASGIPDTVGWEQRDQFLEYGASRADILMLTHADTNNVAVAETIRSAKGIWFSGGDQNRLMDYLGTGILFDAVHEAYRNGAVVAGTSAGAAVMSEIMITGDESRPDAYRSNATIHRDNILVSPGIGLLKGVIVDQHFIRRSRLNRLISTLLDHEDRVAVGIDEATALWVKSDGRSEVLGQSQIVLIEQPNGHVVTADSLHGHAGLKLHVLTPGSTFRITNSGIRDIVIN